MKNYKNIARIKSIDKSNKKRLLKVNPNLDDEMAYIYYGGQKFTDTSGKRNKEY